MPQPEKKLKVESLAGELAGARGIYFTDFSKITARDLTEIRRTLRAGSVKLTVIKNRLALRALKDLIGADIEPYLKGQTALAFSTHDPIAPARIIKGFPQLKVKGAFLEHRLFTREEFPFLANLPTREIIAAELVASVCSPVHNLVSVLEGVLQNLVFTLSALKEAQ